MVISVASPPGRSSSSTEFPAFCLAQHGKAFGYSFLAAPAAQSDSGRIFFLCHLLPIIPKPLKVLILSNALLQRLAI
jgi:hypothetical protein